MNSRSSFLRRLRMILRNPLTNLVIGIVTTVFFFWLTAKGVEPVYLASEAVQASATDTAFELFNSTPQTEKCISKVAFWNHGNSPLTQNLLTGADPLRITASTPVRIVRIRTIHSSRPTLRFGFDTRRPPDQQGRDIYMTIMDGDALDGLDGGAFEIDFIGTCTTQFRVFGRVIGADRIRYRGESTRTFKYWYAMPIMIPLVALLTVSLTLIRLFGSRETRDGVSWPIVIVMWIVVGWVFSYQPFRRPSWMPEFDIVRDPYHFNSYIDVDHPHP